MEDAPVPIEHVIAPVHGDLSETAVRDVNVAVASVLELGRHPGGRSAPEGSDGTGADRDRPARDLFLHGSLYFAITNRPVSTPDAPSIR